MSSKILGNKGYKKYAIYIVLVILPISLFALFIFNSYSNAADMLAPSSAADFVGDVKDATEAGTPTTTCKVGANSAVNVGDLIKIDAANYTYNRNLNFGWVLTVINDIKYLEDDGLRAQVKKLILDFRKSGTSVIFRLCNGAECVGLGPQGSSDAVMATDGKKLGKYLTLLGYELSKDSSAKTSPFWVIAGHNEPNAAEWRTPSAETAFMNALISEVSSSYIVNDNLVELGITDERLVPKGIKPNEALFYSIRSRINLLSPEVQDVPDGAETQVNKGSTTGALKYYEAPSNKTGSASGGGDCNTASGGYFDRMIKCGAIIGELDGIAANLYSIDQIETGLKYAKSKRKKLFILESGPENVFAGGGEALRNVSNNFDTVRAYTDKEAKEYRYTFIDQFINNPQVGAILPFNSLPLSDLTAMTGNVEEDKSFVPYSKNMYQRKDVIDADKFTKLAGSDVRYKTINVSKDVNGVNTEVKIKTEPVSLNMGWPIFYEAQILDFLNSSGCSNVFTRQCNYSTDNSDNNKVFTTSSDTGDTTTAYYDMIDSVKNDDPDSNYGFGEWKSKSVCVMREPDGTCTPGYTRTAVIRNMLNEAVFRADMLTTVQVDLPLGNTLANTNINGTDELNFTHYGGALKRMSYQNDIDFSRKSDATLQVELPGGGGAKTQIAFPQLGSAINLYSRDFTDKSTTDPDVLRKPTDFTNVTYHVPNSSLKDDISSIGRRIEIQNSQLSLKTFANMSTPYTAAGKTNSTRLVRASGTDDSGMTKFTVYASDIHDAVGHDDAKVPTYKDYKDLKLEKDLVQFNASEILSEEAAIERKKVEEAFYVKCSSITEYDKIKGANDKLLDFKNKTTPVSVNYDKDYLGDRCDAFPDGGAPGVDFKVVNEYGQVITDYTGLPGSMIPPGENGTIYPDSHLTTVSKDCYRAWCQLGSNKKKADPDLEFTGGGGTDAKYYRGGGKPQFGFTYFPTNGDYSFYSRIQTGSASILSGSGMMRILRTAWEQSNRLQYKLKPTPVDQAVSFNNTSTGTTNNAYRVCHKNVGLEAKIYTRNYTVSSRQEEYYTGNFDQCYNPNNHIQWSYKRSAVMPENGRVFSISTSEFPWLGTVTAINERISKADYFYKNYGGNDNLTINGVKVDKAALELKECGLINSTDPSQNSESDLMCYCAPDQKDSLAIYLCQNGWLTDEEKAREGLTDADCTSPLEFDSVTGTFSYGSNEKICANYNKPEVKAIFEALEKSSGVPKEILASVWQTESSCTLPKETDDILDGRVQDLNNIICTRCNLEGAGVRDPNSVTPADQKDEGLVLYNSCVAANTIRKQNGTAHSCNDAAVKYNYSGVQQCCDVRGATQFEIGTWNGVIKNPEFIKCRQALSALGLDISTSPERGRFGDSLCGSMTKFSYSNPGVWDNQAIFNIAQSYHGGTGCLPYTEYKQRLSSKISMTVGESYCGRIVDLVNNHRNGSNPSL